MREVKFRAWDKEFNIMCGSDDIMWFDEFITSLGKVVELREEHSYVGSSFHFDDVSRKRVLMQYTGLKDKNGVEIYEGDIVSGDSYEATMLKHWGADVEVSAERYLIKYHDASFKIFDSKGNRLAVLNHHVSSKVEKLEVIGNIYENPELLEVN